MRVNPSTKTDTLPLGDRTIAQTDEHSDDWLFAFVVFVLLLVWVRLSKKGKEGDFNGKSILSHSREVNNKKHTKRQNTRVAKRTVECAVQT